MECSRLWRYLDSEIGLSKVYSTFYELIFQKIKSHLNGTYSGTSKVWGSPKLENELITVISTEVISLDSDDDITDVTDDVTAMETFGQRSRSVLSTSNLKK